MACYNCGSDEHNSKNCDKPPKYTRCGGCDNVASSPDQHKPWCRQKHFVSEYIGQQVYQVKPLFQIKFEVDTNVSIMDASNTIVVQEGLPLWIASVDAHVMRQGRTLQFISARDSKRNFTFVNNHDKAIISLQTDDVSTTFNCRYQIFRNGYVSFEYKRPNSIKTPVVCRIKIHNGDDMFKVNDSERWFIIYFIQFYSNATHCLFHFICSSHFQSAFIIFLC